MRTGTHAAASALRLWWSVPLGLAILTGVVFVSVVMPALAGGPDVPAQLVVPVASTSAGPTATPTTTPTAPAPAATRPSATAHPTAGRPTPRWSPSTTVVVPQQPVVRESDDGHEDSSSSGPGESNDR